MTSMTRMNRMPHFTIVHPQPPRSQPARCLAAAGATTLCCALLLLAGGSGPLLQAADDLPSQPKSSKKAAEKPPAAKQTTPPGASPPMPSPADAAPADDLPKTLAEWRQRLTPEQFQITRMKGTERAFTGKYWNTKTPGTYKCICCGEPLFASGEKFDSGCGWPSFTLPIDGVRGKTVTEQSDTSAFMQRTEVNCRKCGAHLGHVFDDGPPPTGLRYCINSASIQLEPADKPDAKADGAGKTGPEAAGK